MFFFLFLTGIIVITDGMVGLPDATVFESLMVQLRNGTIACSFLRLGNSRSDSCQLGHIPHVELLQFIATATFGAYFSTCPNVVRMQTCFMFLMLTLSNTTSSNDHTGHL